MTSSRKLSTRDLCYIGIFTAVIAIMAQISIPMPLGVPMTLQTLAVPLAGVVLGAKRGTIAAVVYVLLGAVGTPVFTNFGGGFHRIIGPWGGYILSYPFFAFVAGLGANKGNRLRLALGLVVGSIINLSMGMFQYAFVNQLNLQASFWAAVFPFLFADSIKLVIIFVSGPKIQQALVRFM